MKTYLAPAAGTGYHQVSAGTPGPATGAGGKNQTVGGSAAGMEGRANPTMLVDKTMKEGKGAGAKKGLRAGYLGGSRSPGFDVVCKD